MPPASPGLRPDQQLQISGTRPRFATAARLESVRGCRRRGGGVGIRSAGAECAGAGLSAWSEDPDCGFAKCLLPSLRPAGPSRGCGRARGSAHSRRCPPCWAAMMTSPARRRSPRSSARCRASARPAPLRSCSAPGSPLSAASVVWVPVSANNSWRNSPENDARSSLVPSAEAYRGGGSPGTCAPFGGGRWRGPRVACRYLPGQVWLTQQSSGPQRRQEARQIVRSRAARAATWSRGPARISAATCAGSKRPSRCRRSGNPGFKPLSG